MTALPLPQLENWHDDLLAEVHTTDLKSGCDMRVKLRHQGARVAEMPQAMFRGRLAEEAIQYLHEQDEWSPAAARASIPYANAAVDKNNEEEGTVLTESVKEQRGDIGKKVAKIVAAYAERLGPWFKIHQLIGLQTPMNLTLAQRDVPSASDLETGVGNHATQLFATHADMITRDLNGDLWLFDWKYTEDPKWFYVRDVRPEHQQRYSADIDMQRLVRDPQLVLTYLAGRYGSWQLDKALDIWETFEQWPIVCVIHLPSLANFGKAMSDVLCDDGTRRDFKRGEPRPLNRIIRVVPFKPERSEAMIEMLLSKVSAWRDGHFPMKPSDSCQFCECETWCPRFDHATELER